MTVLDKQLDLSPFLFFNVGKDKDTREDLSKDVLFALIDGDLNLIKKTVVHFDGKINRISMV